MRLPNRKPGKYTFPTFDPRMTKAKLQALKDKLENIKRSLPQAIRETQQYGENGDFSENAEYQIAKGRLRGLNKAKDELEYQINHAEIIPEPTNSANVQVGHTVTIYFNNKQQTFTILGSTEAKPTAGIISYQSPLGVALLGHTVGETVILQVGATGKPVKIIAIA